MDLDLVQFYFKYVLYMVHMMKELYLKEILDHFQAISCMLATHYWSTLFTNLANLIKFLIKKIKDYVLIHMGGP